MISRLFKGFKKSFEKQEVVIIYCGSEESCKKIFDLLEKSTFNVLGSLPISINLSSISKKLIHNINEELKKNCILVIVFLDYPSLENYYKIGMAHAYSREVLLIRVFDSGSKEIKAKPQESSLECMRYSFLLACDCSSPELMVGFLQQFNRVLSILVSRNIIEILYQKGIQVCEKKAFLEQELKVISKDAFAKKIALLSKQEINKYADLYIQGKEELEMPLLALIMADKEQLYYSHFKGVFNGNAMTEIDKEVFLSYAWGTESEEVANQVDKAFQAKGITIIRDNRDIGFKGLIQEFMERLGTGKCVVAVVDDKYLKSSNCMFELVKISEHGNFYDRIFPILLNSAKIIDPVDLLDYIDYWQNKIDTLNSRLQKVGSSAKLSNIHDQINNYTDIRNLFDDLAFKLKNMNMPKLDISQQTNFEELIQAIEQKLRQQ